MTFLGLTEHFSGKNGALRWSILVGKQKHNVQKPTALGASQAAKDHGKASKMQRHMGRLSMTPLHRDYRRKSQEAPGYEAGMMR